jgi:hypothetical protein
MSNPGGALRNAWNADGNPPVAGLGQRIRAVDSNSRSFAFIRGLIALFDQVHLRPIHIREIQMNRTACIDI